MTGGGDHQGLGAARDRAADFTDRTNLCAELHRYLITAIFFATMLVVIVGSCILVSQATLLTPSITGVHHSRRARRRCSFWQGQRSANDAIRVRPRCPSPNLEVLEVRRGNPNLGPRCFRGGSVATPLPIGSP